LEIDPTMADLRESAPPEGVFATESLATGAFVEGCWFVADAVAALDAAGATGVEAGTDAAGALIAGVGKSSAAGAGTGAVFFVEAGRGAESTGLEYASCERGGGDASGSVVRFGTVPKFGVVARAVGSSCLLVATGGGRVFGAPGEEAACEPVPMFGPWSIEEAEVSSSAGAVGPSETTDDGL
jgi:hypothetical protein